MLEIISIFSVWRAEFSALLRLQVWQKIGFPINFVLSLGEKIVQAEQDIYIMCSVNSALKKTV